MIESERTSERLLRRRTPVGLPVWKSWTDVPAWIVSMIVHLISILLLFWLWQPSQRGSGGETDRPVGIAVVHVTPSGTEYDLVEAGNLSESNAVSEVISDSSAPPLDTESLLAGISSVGQGSSAGQGTDAASGLSNSASGAPSSGPGRGLRTTTSIYGVEGEGNSFVYVIDRSDSMNGYNQAPWKSAKRELIQSLKSLKPANQFQILFYNETPMPYVSRTTTASGMLAARESELEYAMEFVDRINATGGTEHVAALKMGIRMQPDVLFFLTDADEPRMSATDLDAIVRLCERSGTTIHAVEFGSGAYPGPGRWIEVLANRTGGKYRYVDAKSLLGQPLP